CLRVGIFGSATHEADTRERSLPVRRSTGGAPAGAVGDEERVDALAGALSQYFHSDRSLPGDDVRIVEGMDEGQLPLARQQQRVFICLVVVVSVQDRFAAEIDHGLYLDLRRRLRHYDRRRS